MRAFLDLTHTARWLPDNDAAALGREMLFGGVYGNPVGIASGTALDTARPDTMPVRRRPGQRIDPAEAQNAAAVFVDTARALAAERRFLHWEAAFPGVWSDWESAEPTGGFDAVIGNPPWDRMKLQEVEWFAARVPEIAHAQRAADRKRMVAEMQRRGEPIAADYARAAWVAETATRVARGCGAYPLLSGGDVNIYSLFVERAMRLVRRDGVVGLLVPSGIAADFGAAKFFRTISTTGRLASLLDFENGRRQPDPFFPDVHRSFKFCTFGRRWSGALNSRTPIALSFSRMRPKPKQLLSDRSGRFRGGEPEYRHRAGVPLASRRGHHARHLSPFAGSGRSRADPPVSQRPVR